MTICSTWKCRINNQLSIILSVNIFIERKKWLQILSFSFLISKLQILSYLPPKGKKVGKEKRKRNSSSRDWQGSSWVFTQHNGNKLSNSKIYSFFFSSVFIAAKQRKKKLQLKKQKKTKVWPIRVREQRLRLSYNIIENPVLVTPYKFIQKIRISPFLNTIGINWEKIFHF